MDLYRLTIQDSQDSMQFDLLDAPIKIEDVEGAVDNTVLSGDIFTDFLYLKKRWEQKWAIMCKDEYERLRGFYTRQWSLATVPSVKVTQGYLKDTEWEGQIIYINAPYGGEASSLTKMTGDTFQQSYEGKNLIYLSPNTTASTLHGLVATYDEATGMCHVSGTSDNGTPNGGGWSNIGLETACSLHAGTYTFSTTSTRDYRILLRIYSNASNYVTVQLDRNVTSAQVTTTFTAVKYRIHLESLRNSPIDDTWGIMLESGSQATTFQRYLGGYPSPNPEFPQPIQTVTGQQTISINGTDFPINLGKNLFDKDAVTTGVYINSSGATSPGNNYAASDYIPVVPNAKYYYSGSTNLVGNAARLAWYKADKTFISASTYGYEGELTAPTDAFFFRTSIRINTGSGQDPYLDTYQFEAGDKKTDYAPYFAPIELCKLGNAQDSIYYDGTDWILEKQTVTRQFNGDDTDISAGGWFNSGETTATTQVVAINCRSVLDGKYNGHAYSLMTHFHYVSDNTSPVENGMFKTLTGTGYPDSIVYIRLGISKAIAPDVNSAKAWIAANKPTIYMPKLTPIQTTITDQALIAQLEAVRAALIEGQNLVEVTANGSNLPAKSITLQGIEGRENPILPQTNVRIGLSDGGVLNACECRQNVTLSMRETA